MNGRTWAFSALATVAVLGSFPAAGSAAGSVSQTAALQIAANSDERWDNAFARPGVGRDVFAVAHDGVNTYAAFSGTAVSTTQPANYIARWDGKRWDPLGSGTNGRIYSIAIADGLVYVGGDFTLAGGGSASHIAAWNPTTKTWTGLGSGLSVTNVQTLCSGPQSEVNVGDIIAAPGGGVYVGGCFDHAGGVVAYGVAKWTPSTSTWSALGTGITRDVDRAESGDVQALTMYGSSLLAGGLFKAANNLPVMSLALWNGTSWSSPGAIKTDTGAAGTVLSFAVNTASSTLYIGGTFATAGTTAVANLASWTQAAGFAAVGGGVSDSGPGVGPSGPRVAALAWKDGALYVGGRFGKVAALSGSPDASMPDLAMWDSTFGWVSLSTHATYTPPNSDINALVATADALLIGGTFYTIDTVAFWGIASWAYGGAWGTFGQGIVAGRMRAMAIAPNGDVYVAGATVPFNASDGTPIREQYAELQTSNIARWDGSHWHALSSGVIGDVRALAVAPNGDLYVGGIIYAAGATPVANIAKWNGSTWSALGAGVPASVNALAIIGDYLYAGNSYTAIGGDRNYLAKWRISTGGWSPVLSGWRLTGATNALAVLYARYLVIGGDSASLIGASATYAMNGLLIYDPVSNTFFQTGGVLHDVGAGTWAGGKIRSLAIVGSKIFAGGVFGRAGGAAGTATVLGTNNIASVDTATVPMTWSALSTGIGGSGTQSVDALATYGTDVYVGGDFTTAGPIAASHVARWSTVDGAWSTLGSGIAGDVGDTTVAGLVPTRFGLFVAGSFRMAGTRAAMAMDVFHTPPWVQITSGPVTGGYSPPNTSISFVSDQAVTTYTCVLDGASVDPCTSPLQLSGLNPGPHGFAVYATDVYGTGPTTSLTWTVADPPVATIVSGPSAGAWSGRSATFNLGSNHVGSSYQCSLDNATFSTCSSPATFTGLVGGGHTLQVRAVDGAGTGPATSRSWNVDAAAPTSVKMVKPTSQFTTGSTLGISWSATDAASGISTYDVRYRRAAYSGGFGALTYPAAWQKTSGAGSTITGSPGYDYCFSVRARDKVGNTSGWSAEKCTAVPLDDRALAASTGWTRITGTGYYLSTATRTTTAGAKLSRASTQAMRYALVATHCTTCGIVDVYVGSTLIKSINLYAATTQNKVLSAWTSTYRTGTVYLRARTAGKLVVIDGLGLSRT